MSAKDSINMEISALEDEKPSEAKKPKLDVQETPVHSDQDLPKIDGKLDDTNCDQGPQEKSQQNLQDPLSYTRGKEFTSEIFKIQIHNLPKFGFTDLKKRLKSLGLNPNKIKSPDRQSVAYICFRNEEERDKALEKVNGHVWKNRKLEAKIAAPVADPYLQKKNQGNGSHAVSLDRQRTKELTPEEAEERLRNNVCPLWNLDYSQQLQQKTEKVKNVLRQIAQDNFVKWMFRNIKTKFDGMPCELLPIVPSPETCEYRNKNEFTIGYDLDVKTVMVGFRYGLYKDGTTSVGDCSNLGIAMPAAVPVVKSFTEFVSKSKWTPYLQHAGTGHWQTLTVRTFRTGDIMVMVDFVPRDLHQSEIEEAKVSLREFYTSGEGSKINVKSFYFRVIGKKGSSSGPDLQLLFGEEHVFESLMKLRFRISPQAFFQVNTPATEKLYSLISDWCEASSNTTLLDVCCGTGTIGLSMAKTVKEVIGIEMCTQAVEDARANVAINAALRDVVAVVDPPRAGLHKDVIRVLRRCTSIQRLVYVSCNPEIALTNFIDLIRPETGRHKGSPFTLVKAVPVDLFPGTKHCELVLLFTRESPKSSPPTDSAAVAAAESGKDDSFTIDSNTVEMKKENPGVLRNPDTEAGDTNSRLESRDGKEPERAVEREKTEDSVTLCS
ncbi:tRNA (uracil-5-)-methyltransferase homolog a-like [Plakobranchus ocellatus]|uniref:tRNA (uracil(54)-C(5))-methyltransferase n=1 Tax=Plakobranchus ocellatus TaxID=259542 RepID=A0AAV4DG16_9GAST|nr:tRNA (uracil-5-)-methyltransferase homolog a-like [Plakobranchus ocellatus]